MVRYTKRPVTIDALQYTGDNCADVHAFLGYEHDTENCATRMIEIETLEGTMTASQGDWIIKGVKGEFYPCKPEIFELTYEPEFPLGPAR